MALKLYTGKNSDIKVYASDWRVFVKELNKIDPQQIKELKKRWKVIAEPARESVRNELKGEGAGKEGPFAGSVRKKTGKPANGMAHGGRTGWGTNYGTTGGPVSNARRKPYNLITTSALTRNKKGATGIARLIVRSAGVVFADLAQKPSGNSYTRMYKIREFGGPEIMRSHQIRSGGVNNFLSKLGPVVKASKRKKSRRIYPGFDSAYPQVAKNAKVAIEETIRFVEKNIDRNNS
jgi:hypothetical protein